MRATNCPQCTFYEGDRARCGWCITHDHLNCVVVVEMGHARSKDPETGRLTPRQKPQPYLWRCGCGCEASAQEICVECRRVGVNLLQGKCVDTRHCAEARERVVRPKVSDREIR